MVRSTSHHKLMLTLIRCLFKCSKIRIKFSNLNNNSNPNRIQILVKVSINMITSQSSHLMNNPSKDKTQLSTLTNPWPTKKISLKRKRIDYLRRVWWLRNRSKLTKAKTNNKTTNLKKRKLMLQWTGQNLPWDTLIEFTSLKRVFSKRSVVFFLKIRRRMMYQNSFVS